MSDAITIAMVGNPNSGKTTVFNALTGQRQHVANYPGVTVEIMEGEYSVGGERVAVIDLPGTYSLDSSSPDALVARDYILKNPGSVVVQIINAQDFERHAFLTAQLLELGANLVLVLNMSDRARSQGISFDLDMIRERLGCEVVEAVASCGEGLDEMKQAVARAAKRVACSVEVDYGEEMGEHRLAIEEELNACASCISPYPPRWLAIKVLEGSREAQGILRRCLGERAEGIIERAQKLARHIEGHHGDELTILLAERRHGFAAGLYREVTRRDQAARGEMTDRIDDIVTHRWFGIPLFLGIMYLVFYATFTLGAVPMGWIEAGVSWLSEVLATNWPGEGPIKSLVIDGVIGGVGNVLVFVPNIAMLFLCISIIEDTGYMSRVAFITDRFMHKFGLHGKSVIPMIIGFGCSVPAIMATRTIENRRDRLATMFVIPLMSCGARLPIYTLFIPAFFPKEWRATVLWSIYITGVVLALVLVRLIRSTIVKGATVPFVMELPPYRMPTLRSIAQHVAERSWLYIRKAGTIILGISIVMWAMASFPRLGPDAGTGGPPASVSADAEDDLASRQLAHSYVGRMGRAMEPIVSPMGFDWRIGTALVGAFAAKEVFVAQLGIVYSVGSPDETGAAHLRENLRADYSPLVGFCIMLFALIASPCMATVAVIRRESGSWGWAAFQFLGLTALASVVTVIVYQVGEIMGVGV